jgi:1-acyl-sn-glycerol-3-phosphate acyltransferase
MRRVWLAVRSVICWASSGLFFLFAVMLLMVLAVFFDPRKFDWLQRAFCRNILRLSGAQLRVQRAPGFDPRRTCFFIVNHVNLFDPFILYCAIPQFVRGLELESHFRIPVYGWLMKRYGNVPVPDVRRPSDLKRMWKMTGDALERGTSIIVFAEGKRTVTGRVGEFEDGGFRLAQHFGCPIVPVTVTGSFEFNRKDRWWLHPSTITVHIHDTIETNGLRKGDTPALRQRVRAIVSAPVDAYYENFAKAVD